MDKTVHAFVVSIASGVAVLTMLGFACALALHRGELPSAHPWPLALVCLTAVGGWLCGLPYWNKPLGKGVWFMAGLGLVAAWFFLASQLVYFRT